MPTKLKRPAIKLHPQIKAIERELIKGTPYRVIAERYDLEYSALSRYKSKHLSKKSNVYQAKKDYREGEIIYQLLGQYIENVNKIANSCLKAMEDPEDPELLDVGVQADEVTVTYMTEDEDGKPVKRREKLQQLLDRVDGLKTRIEINTPDRIQTLIQASHAMNKHLHLLGDLRGMIGNTTVNITNQPLFISFTQQVITALDQFPEARQVVAEFIRAQAIGADPDSVQSALPSGLTSPSPAEDIETVSPEAVNDQSASRDDG